MCRRVAGIRYPALRWANGKPPHSLIPHRPRHIGAGIFFSQMNTPVKTITQIYQENQAAEAERQRKFDEQRAQEKAEAEAKALAQFNSDFPSFAAVCAASGITVEGTTGKYTHDAAVRFSYKSYQHVMALSHQTTTDSPSKRIGTIQPDRNCSFDHWGMTRLAEALYINIVQKGDQWEKNCEPFRTSTDPKKVALNYRANNMDAWVDFATFKDAASRNGSIYEKWAPNMSFEVPNPTSYPLSAEEKAAYWQMVADEVNNADAQDWPWNNVARP